MAVKSTALTTVNVFPDKEALLANLDQIGLDEISFVPFNPFPAGAVYMSLDPTDPSKLFGGQWQALNEGRVLLGANSSYPAGSKGGETSHRLTTSEMPSHSHSASLSSAGSHYHRTFGTGNKDGGGFGTNSQSCMGCWGDWDNPWFNTSSAGSHSHSVSLYSAGGSSSHNNMQPYLAVYMWTCISQDGLTQSVLMAVKGIPTSVALTTIHVFLKHSSFNDSQAEIKENDVALVPFNPFPIGYIYMSMNANDPANLFGGKWQALNEGRVLIGANSSYPAGSKGGATTHKLTTSEMPSHSHGGSSSYSAGSHSHGVAYGEQSRHGGAPYGYYSSSHNHWGSAGSDWDNSEWNSSTDGSHSHSLSVSSAGGTSAHNNMQPYLAVYMWKRIA